MRLTIVLTALNLLIWGLLFLSGRSLIAGVVRQHVASFPNDGQIGFYVTTPAVVFSAALLCGAAAWKWRGGWWAVAQGLLLVALLPYLLVYGGGV